MLTTTPATTTTVRQQFGRLGLAFFALLALTLGGQYTASLLVAVLAPQLAETEAYRWLLSLLPIYAVALPVCLLLLRPCQASTPLREKTKPMGIGGWLLALVFSFGLMYAGNMIGSALMFGVNLLRGEEMANPVLSLVMEASPFWTVLATVVVAPLGEEFIFRRLLLDRTRRYGDKTAIIVSAAAFGLFHLNFYQFFYAFLLGLVFGYVYVRTGRLRYTVALHAVINFCGGVLAPMLTKAYLGVIEPLLEGGGEAMLAVDSALLPAMLGYFVYAMLLFGCMIASIVLAIVLRRRLVLEAGEERARPAEILGNFGVMAYIVVCAVLMVLHI